MERYRLEDMVRGWFVGNFTPTVLSTPDVEVGVKSYRAGDYEDRHHHRIATEVTLIQAGEVEMNGQRYRAGDILVIKPHESTDFRALTDAVTVVVKVPGASNDKYPG